MTPVPRAFALGDPPEICPSRVAAAGGQDVAEAAAAALRGCFADLSRAEAPAECGCRIVAADRALTAPPADFAYAPGVSTWIKSPELGLDLLVAAHETVTPSGARRLQVVGDPHMTITADLGPDGRAELLIERTGRPPLLLTGTHRPEGLRRGRFAERAWLTDPEGRDAILLSGYEPLEFAMRRGELLSTK
ncbi:hypothetical protein ACQ5SO_19320 [Rhodovulum sp. DZ06]|uniref:hypothetical protein n=1 Tax=Rhodovulum sp. DZ06 TaxID=3425126 RepID=UPI003D340AA2